MDFSRCVGTPKLLTSLALGKGSECPFLSQDIATLKKTVVDTLAARSMNTNREGDDQADVLVDFRFLDLLLRASSDPEVAVASFTRGLRVGSGMRLPRLPALDRLK